MKQFTGKGRGVWFWVGVVLLSISVLWWLIFIIAIVSEPKDVVVSFVVWLLLSALPIGIGIYCVMHGRKVHDKEVRQATKPTYTTQTAVEPAEEMQSIEQETTTAMKTMKNAGGLEILASSQCMVIRPIFSERFGLIFGLAFVIVWSIIAQFIPIILIRVLFSVFGILMGLLILRGFLGSKIFIDKPTQTVTINKRSFFLASRQRVIPFSDVENVVIDYEQKTSMSGPHGGTTSYDAWKVSLDIGEKVEIKNTTKKANMLYLASEISRFIGRELVDNSAKPESSFTGLFRKVKGFFRK